MGGYFIFFLLGYLIDNMEFSVFQRHLLYILALAGVLFRYIFTLYASKIAGATDTRVWGYVQFHSVILAVAVFVFLKNVDLEKIPLQIHPLISQMSRFSFGVYLSHRVVMWLEQNVFGIDGNGFFWRVGMIPVTYLICLLMVMILSKIPLLKKVVGC